MSGSIEMSQKELDRYHNLTNLVAKELTQKQAGALFFSEKDNYAIY